MAVKEVESDEEFQAIIEASVKSKELVAVDFFAIW